MKKTYIGIVIALLGLVGSSPFLRAQPARVLYTSADLLTPTANTNINRIIDKPINNSLVIRLKDGSTQRVPIKSVWGYIREDGIVFRRYKQDFLEIISREDSILYKNSLILQMGRSNRVLINHYYSKNLDSPIFRK